MNRGAAADRRYSAFSSYGGIRRTKEKHCGGKELQSLRLSTPVLESRVQCVVERRGH